MKTLLKSTLHLFARAALVLAAVLNVSGCTTEALELQQDFPFGVEVMPVPREVAAGQTVEIRLAIRPAGNYSGTAYYLRYFQFDGQGILRCGTAPPYLPNDRYKLPAKEFRLYFTALSAGKQAFDVWISDSFGNEQQLQFQFGSGD